jgi:hypothetical protein
MSLIEVNWRPQARELKRFGLSNLVILGLAGALFLWRGYPTVAWVLWGLGGVTGVLGLSGTRAGLPGYWLFMGVGLVVGNVVGRLLLALLYYLFFTPLALLRRLRGSDPLQLQRPETESYWREVQGTGGDYERQF